MYNLLKAGFFRLKKDIIFWLFLFITIGISVFSLIRIGGDQPNADLSRYINEFIMYIGLLISIFVSIFVGKEYSEGIIRNKVIVGHKRRNIYLANLIISIIVSLICEFIYVVLILLVYGSKFGGIQALGTSLSEIIVKIVDTILVIIAFCSIFNFITMICREITISTTICTLLFIALFIAQAAFSLTANETPYLKEIDQNGNIIITEDQNPTYPGDFKVKTAKVFYLLNPEGQAMELGGKGTSFLYYMPMYSTGLILVINVIGVILFDRKELK